MPTLSISDRFVQRPDIALLSIKNMDTKALQQALKTNEEAMNQSIRDNQAQVWGNIGQYKRFFEKWGYSCPLGDQLSHVLAKGLPKAPPLIRLLLGVELTYGILAGIQSADALEGDLLFVPAREGETFVGMRGPITCVAEEPVLRDDDGIIASLLQGPDARTRLQSSTVDLFAVFFGASELDPQVLTQALEFMERWVKPYCSETKSELFLNPLGVFHE